MESPPILITRASDNQRRLSTTSQLFRRLDKSPTGRQLKTSKLPRAFPHSISKQSLENSKQNMSYENYLQKIKAALKSDEKSVASNYLLSLRKQYDKMSKNIKEQSSSINIMKKQILFMKNKIKNQTDFQSCSQDRLQFLKAELQDIHIKQDQGKMETKMLQHIIARMKQDQLQRKSLCQFKELQTKEVKKQVKLKQDEILQWDQSIHKMFEQMSKLKADFKKNCQQRELKFQDYKLHMVDLEQQQKFEKQRRERTFQLLSMESNDIMDAKNIVLRDVLMTNKVLDKLLESKINDLLSHYQELQSSYHLIKTQTNLADPQLLAKKFFSYSETLEEITAAITYYEQKQENLSQRNKQLKQIEKQKVIKKLQEDRLLTHQQNQAEEQKEKLIHECQEKELTIKRIKMWFDKISETIGCRKSNEVSLAKQIEQICEAALKKTKQIQEDPEKMNHKFQSPGIRLKKILMKQFTTEDEKRRSEAQEVNQSNIFENIYLNYQRKQVKKNQFQIKIQAKPAKQ